MKKLYKFSIAAFLLVTIISSSIVLSQVPAVQLKFNGNILNSGSLNINTSVKGTPEFAAGIEGKSLNLSASSKSRRPVILEESEKLSFKAQQDFSVVVWVKMEKGTIDDKTIITNKNSGSPADTGWVIASQNNGSWRWNIGNGRTNFDYEPTLKRQPINDGKWHQLAFTVDRNIEEARMFYDGLNVAIYNVKDIGDLTSRHKISIGAGSTTKNPEWDSFNGYIDNVNIRDRVLTEDEVKADYLKFIEHKSSSPVKKISGLKVMAFNIWHGGREHGEIVGVNRVIEIIKDSGADIISMIETYGSGAKIADALGYYFYLRSSNLSIMSRYPIGETFDIFQPFNSGGAVINLSEEQRINFYTIWLHYLPSINLDKPGLTSDSLIYADNKTRGFQIKAIIKQIRPQLENADEIPVILAGDFNSESHFDWTEAAARLHKGFIVEWPVSKAIIDAGMTDSFREIYPDPVSHIGKTWSTQWQNETHIRIDYIYYKGNSLQAVDSRVIDQHKVKFPSDHAALLTTFKLK
ncbi:LamG-like jellyroll fold domain-containing protein [candidate division KSB1 bacterium]